MRFGLMSLRYATVTFECFGYTNPGFVQHFLKSAWDLVYPADYVGNWRNLIGWIRRLETKRTLTFHGKSKPRIGVLSCHTTKTYKKS